MGVVARKGAPGRVERGAEAVAGCAQQLHVRSSSMRSNRGSNRRIAVGGVEAAGRAVYKIEVVGGAARGPA